MIELDGAVVIVTGSTRGVGGATVRLLAARGANVVVNYAKSADQAEAVAADCRAKGVEALVAQGDVAVDADCRRIVKRALDEWGRIDGLINNAGATKFCAHHDLDGLDAADFLRIYGVNTVGPYQMIRAAAPHMRARGKGAVVNVSSVAGLYGVGSSIAYVASKGALNAMTLALARALGPEIKVNAVCPGFIAGNWLKEGMGEKSYERVKSHLEATTPLRSVNAPEDIARAILWLLADAPNITGEILSVDSGMGLMRGNLSTLS